MAKPNKNLTNLIVLCLAFIIFMLVFRSMTKSDGGGIMSIIVVVGGWGVFLYFLVKLLVQLFRSPHVADKPADPVQPISSSAPQINNGEGNSRLFIYLAFLLFMGLIAGSTNQVKRFINPLAISNAFGIWFWVITGIAFFVGLGGVRIQKAFRISTYDGGWRRGYLDFGAEKGTNGLPGAISLTTAFVSVYIIWTAISHWMLKKPFPEAMDLKMVVAIIIGSFFIIPLYFLFLRLFRAPNRTGLIIGGVWLIALAIIARL
ncbi:hypothetical protein HB364_25995 [Pseudoflavitalea sp. X16]|uniref:hypothetical protein n=1 Tax=Paraflavitalea devenefica TaxID=2716334 RepID=UPI001420F9FE|nr:hypothetical protein [Paraflavitalea devenefica]NII28562.1 hypothetical protein [Paraflavitalea devenefica]